MSSRQADDLRRRIGHRFAHPDLEDRDRDDAAEIIALALRAGGNQPTRASALGTATGHIIVAIADNPDRHGLAVTLAGVILDLATSYGTERTIDHATADLDTEIALALTPQ
jgi:hypothetical protein